MANSYLIALKRSFTGVPWRFFRRPLFIHITVLFVAFAFTSMLVNRLLERHLIDQYKQQMIGNFHAEINRVSNILDLCSKTANDKWYQVVIHNGKALCSTSPNFKNTHQLENLESYNESSYKSKIVDGVHQFSFVAETRNLAISQEKIFVHLVVHARELGGIIKKYAMRSALLFLALFLLSSISLIINSLQVASPLGLILDKIAKMKKSIPKTEVDSPWDDEWIGVAKDLDAVQHGIEKYIADIYSESAKMKAVMAAIDDAIVAIDTQDKVMFANKRFHKNFVIQGGKKYSIPDLKLWEINRSYEIYNLFKQAMQSANAVRAMNVEIPVKGQATTSYFDVKVGPVVDQDYNVVGAVGVFSNVIDRKLTEQMREDFIANISHEVRSPLTVLKGLGQMLSDEIPSHMHLAHNYLERIDGNIDRLTKLFSDMLKLSTIEFSNKIDKEQIFVEHLCFEVIDHLQQVYADKQIQTSVICRHKTLWGDPVLLEQVITNLLDNAFKYSAAHCKVSIVCDREYSTEGAQDVLVVHNTGESIPQEHLLRIFERFYRVKSQKRESGFGLGLAIVKHIVIVHGGSVAATNSSNGPKFILKLPGLPIKEQQKQRVDFQRERGKT